MCKNKYRREWVNGPCSSVGVIINSELKLSGDCHVEIWSTYFEANYSVTLDSCETMGGLMGVELILCGIFYKGN